MVAPPPGQGRHPVAWQGYSVDADGRGLTFTYYSGVEPCSVYDSASVLEGPDQVEVTIYERDDAPPGTACVMLAKEKSATVTLAAPLAGRTVVDGARR